jgi:hypothetical protein
MKSPVLELQHDAMNGEADLTSLLRKCVVIASKLDLKDFLAWTNNELRGYSDDEKLPSYRLVPAELKGFNPYNGMWLPLMFQEDAPTWARQRGLSQSIAELEAVIDKSINHIELSLPENLARRLMESADMPRPPVSHININCVIAVLDAVRNVILDWSLKLEANGILGEGMVFTTREKQAAMSNTYNIQNFNGILGPVNATSIEIKNYTDLHQKLKDSGISQEERNEIEFIMDEILKSHGEAKKSLISRGSSWVLRNAKNLGELSEAIHTWVKSQ